MHTSLRAVVAATVLAIAATATVAAAVEPGSAPAGKPGKGRVASIAPVTPDAPPALPAVTTADIDPEVLAAAHSSSSDESQTVVEVIELTVIGGELELVTDHATVTLQRVPGSSRNWVGVLPPVRVIDARGTHEGWAVRWDVVDLTVPHASGRVRVVGDDPTMVAGLADGLYGSRGRTLFGALHGYGGGTYEAGATVTLQLPPKVDADQVVVELSFSLA